MLRDPSGNFTLHHIDPSSSFKRVIAQGKSTLRDIFKEVKRPANLLSDLERADLEVFDQFCTSCNYDWDLIQAEHKKQH